VTPTIVTPTSIGGVTVGHAFSVGSVFAVGHDSAPADQTPSPDRSRRHDRSHDVETVFVPVAVAVPVPVYVPVASVEDEALSNEPVISEDLPSPAMHRATSLTRTRASRGYVTFSPWYYVGLNLQAGYPVPLPAPETFAEGNISSTVAVTERTADDSAENVSVSVVGYAKDVGGIAFMVQPADAAVYVDGRFVGSAGDYAPEHEPLLLRFGVYTVELRAKGYATERFSAYVTLGEVIPFKGSMTKAQTVTDDRRLDAVDSPAQLLRDDDPSRGR
jgi:hypothetical protein